MGIFNGPNVEDFLFDESAVYDEGTNCDSEEVSDEELEECGVIECTDEPEVAGYRIALENEQNYNSIMQAIMREEYSVLESTGTEMVYESGKVKSFFEKIEKMIKTAWAKVMGVIKRANDWIVKYTRENAAFVKKYKSKVNDYKDVEKWDIKGYLFTGLKNDKRAAALKDAIKNMIDTEEVSKATKNTSADTVKELKDREEKDMNTLDNAIVFQNTSNQKMVNNFSDDLKEQLKGGKEPEALPKQSFKDVLDEMEKGIGSARLVKNIYQTNKNIVKELLARVKKLEKSTNKDDDASPRIAVANEYVKRIKHATSLMSKGCSVTVSMVFARAKQQRAVAMYIIKNQPDKNKKEGTNESAFLSDVEFI